MTISPLRIATLCIALSLNFSSFCPQADAATAVIGQAGGASTPELRGQLNPNGTPLAPANPAAPIAPMSPVMPTTPPENPSAAAAPPPAMGETPTDSSIASKKLQGTANISDVTATAGLVEGIPFHRVRDENLKFVEVTLRNDSSQVCVINGDASQASIGARTAQNLDARYVVGQGRPGLTKDKTIIVLASTAAMAGLTGPITYEYITPSQHRNRSLGMAVGVDGTRHIVEAERFGVRVLMPGDETQGWMAFSCTPDEMVRTVTIPVSFSRSLAPDGVLEVPVRSGVKGNQTTTIDTQQNSQAVKDAIQHAKESAQQSGAPRLNPGFDSMMQDSTVPSSPATPPPAPVIQGQ